MARRGGPVVSDSDDSDVTEDDDVSDVEDDLLRQKVRAAAAVRGGGHTAHTSVSDPHDGVGARAGTGTAGRGVTSGAPGVSGSVPSTGGAAATTTTGNSHRVNTHTNNTTNNTADPQIDDEERAVLCFAVDDDDDVTNNNAPRTVAGVNSGQIGPELRKLRQAQGEHAEYYTLEHYDRLYGRRVKWDRNSRGSKTWCKDVHGPGCTECTSCHFCRQKTSDVKTRCQCGEWRKQPPEAGEEGLGAAGASRCAWGRTLWKRSGMTNGGAPCVATFVTAAGLTAKGTYRAFPKSWHSVWCHVWSAITQVLPPQNVRQSTRLFAHCV